jgi:hypothetical protein
VVHSGLESQRESGGGLSARDRPFGRAVLLGLLPGDECVIHGCVGHQATSPITAFVDIVTTGVCNGMNLTMQVGRSSVKAPWIMPTSHRCSRVSGLPAHQTFASLD